MTLRGSCHCGNLEVELDTAIAPEAFEVRACQCSFCSRHGARTISDPQGHLVIRIADADKLCRYRFGLQTSEALVCGNCGCYVAAVMPEPPQRATLNARVLGEWERFTAPVKEVDYSNETKDDRVARRKKGWTPTELVLTPAAPAGARGGASGAHRSRAPKAPTKRPRA